MTAEYFVYTRSKNIDYKLMFSPSENLCPSQVRKEFRKEVRGVINIERYDQCLESPLWFISKKDDLILFGIGAKNRDLSDECTQDFAGRGVRGFFGFIIKAEEIVELPFDINFFKDFYKDKICPLWDCDSQQFKQTGIPVELDMSKYNTIAKGNTYDVINTDTNKTVIHPIDTSLEWLFSNSLACPENNNVLGIVKSKAHATDEEYKFMNCVVDNISNREERIYKPTTQTIDPWNQTADNTKINQNPEDEIKRKKVKRLKYLAVFAIIALLALILILLKLKFKK